MKIRSAVTTLTVVRCHLGIVCGRPGLVRGGRENSARLQSLRLVERDPRDRPFAGRCVACLCAGAGGRRRRRRRAQQRIRARVPRPSRRRSHRVFGRLALRLLSHRTAGRRRIRGKAGEEEARPNAEIRLRRDRACERRRNARRAREELRRRQARRELRRLPARSAARTETIAGEFPGRESGTVPDSGGDSVAVAGVEEGRRRHDAGAARPERRNDARVSVRERLRDQRR